MSQRGFLPPLRVTVPSLGNSPSQRLSKYHIAFSPSPTPAPVIYQRPHSGSLWIGVLLQLSSLYAAHQWLIRSQGQAEKPCVIKFAFLAFFGASVVLGFLQRPWKGRSISSSQWSLLFISGALLALSFLFRMRGLADVGPLETILAEYAGAVVGKVIIKSQRKVHGIADAKFRGAVAFLVGLFLLSQGWGISSCSPLSSIFLPATKTRKPRLTRATAIGYTTESRAYLAGENVGLLNGEDCTKYVNILAPVLAGLLSSMQKLLPSSTNLSTLPKKRLQALTYVTAGAVFVPVALFQLVFPMGRSTGGIDQQALWPLFSMIAFGMVVAFYGDFYSEEKLLISPLSSFHFFVTVCGVCLLELIYGSNFSLLGFVVCSSVLAVGVRAGAFISGGLDWNSMSEKEYDGASIFSMMKTPIYHIWTDVKTRKIAMFLLLNTSFMFVEFLYGFLSNSLGLISDACHMLFDCAALAIGLYASYISRLPPNSKFNFGYGRFEVLSGYANAVFLILVASLIVLESLERLLEPPEISTESLLVVSVGGLLVNVVGLIFFHEAHHHAHGNAPCTHVHHAHSDKFIPTPTLKVGNSVLNAHNSSSKPAIVHSHDEGEDSPILNLQHSSSRGHDHDSHQQSFHDEEQFSKEQFIGHNTGHSGFEGKVILDHSHSHSKLQHSDHSHSHSHHHSHHHADNSSPGHLCPLHSPPQIEHQHSASCSHNHEDQHDHQNPFAQQGLLHSAHKHSGACSHKHEHQDGHSGSHNPSFLQHSQSLSGNQQVGTRSAHDHDHDHGHGINITNALSHSGTEHQHSGIAKLHQEVETGRRVSHQHQHQHNEAGTRSVSDHAAGHVHHHGGQPCSHDHDDHHKGHHGQDHGHSHSGNGGHHNHHEGHDHDHGDHHHHHEGHLHVHVHDHDHDHDHDEHGDHHHIDHNMEGIFLHILADTLGSVGVVISTLLIKYKGWLFTDPACSIFISVLIVSSVLPLVRNSAELLLQRVPRSADKRLQKALRKVEEVEGVHDWHKLHVWSNTNTELVGTLRLHAYVGTDKMLVHKKVSRILEEAGIMDLTLEVEDLEHEDDQ